MSQLQFMNNSQLSFGLRYILLIMSDTSQEEAGIIMNIYCKLKQYCLYVYIFNDISYNTVNMDI